METGWPCCSPCCWVPEPQSWVPELQKRAFVGVSCWGRHTKHAHASIAYLSRQQRCTPQETESNTRAANFSHCEHQDGLPGWQASQKTAGTCCSCARRHCSLSKTSRRSSSLQFQPVCCVALAKAKQKPSCALGAQGMTRAVRGLIARS